MMMMRNTIQTQTRTKTICEYCLIEKPYSIIFTDLNQRQQHIISNHNGYSVNATIQDLKRFRQSVPTYSQKLKQKMKEQLLGSIKEDNDKRDNNDHYYY